VIAFAADAARARQQLAGWLGSRSWFADARLRRARVEDLRGVYVPAYLYSAVAHTEYTASIGEHYTEIEMRPMRPMGETGEIGEIGEPVTEARRVTRTEYRPLAGRHVGYVTDVLVSASTGLAAAELAALEPFELGQLRRYAPALVTGWIAEEFSREPDGCRRASREAALDEIALELRRFLPGDSHCDLAWRTTVEWESLEPILVPVWVLAVRYRDDRPALRVVINGQTGAVAGRVPWTAWKIAAAIALAVLAVAAVLVVWHGAPP
jgi:hypothetical protein